MRAVRLVSELQIHREVLNTCVGHHMLAKHPLSRTLAAAGHGSLYVVSEKER